MYYNKIDRCLKNYILQAMALEYGALVDTCEDWVGSNCDVTDPYVKRFLGEISRAINNVMCERYRELHPHAPGNTVLPPNMEVTPEMLLKVQTAIDRMMAQETIASHFGNLLSSKERGVFIELCNLYTSFCDNETLFIEKIRTDIVPQLTTGTPLYRAVQLILVGIPMEDALYRIFTEGGRKVTSIKRPASIVDFVARFREFVMRMLAGTQNRVPYALPSATQAFEVN